MSNRTPQMIEASLRVENLDTARVFYQSLFGLRAVMENTEVVGLGGGAGPVLMLYSRHPSDMAGDPFRTLVNSAGFSHGIRFAIAPEHMGEMERYLSLHGVAIEGRARHRCGGTSMFFRDPDGHAVEITSALS